MSATAHALRLHIETLLQPRIPGALTPRPHVLRDVRTSGVLELDTLLDGGFPVGAITELVGPLCAGRTTLALATLAEMTQAAMTVAWVDTTDALDPESAAAAGVDLARQLWVRCGHAPCSHEALDTAISGNPEPALLAKGSRVPAPSGGCGSPHPRSEVRGLSAAVDAFLQPDIFARPAPPRDPTLSRRNRMIGTPSAPNRPLLPQHGARLPSKTPLDRIPQDPRPFPRRSPDREEQIPTDRQPSRRQVLYAQQNVVSGKPATLQAAQIANTAAAAAKRRHGPPQGAWTDNQNNAHGRSLATAPNAIAAGLPRFRELEARAGGQRPILPSAPPSWKPEIQNPNSSSKAAKSLAGDPGGPGKGKSPLWSALDQALRTTDLLLASGGFAAVVLDLGGIPPEYAWRIPLATWFRFRAGADRGRTVLLLLTQRTCARSSAELVLRLDPSRPEDASTVLTGAAYRVTVDRRRFQTETTHEDSQPQPAGTTTIHLVSSRNVAQRKPPQRAVDWSRAAAWATSDSQSRTGGLS